MMPGPLVHNMPMSRVMKKTEEEEGEGDEESETPEQLAEPVAFALSGGSYNLL